MDCMPYRANNNTMNERGFHNWTALPFVKGRNGRKRPATTITTKNSNDNNNKKHKLHSIQLLAAVLFDGQMAREAHAPQYTKVNQLVIESIVEKYKNMYYYYVFLHIKQKTNRFSAYVVLEFLMAN